MSTDMILYTPCAGEVGFGTLSASENIPKGTIK